MKYDEIKTPQQLLEYMKKNIKYGFVGKNGKIYKDTQSEEWNDWYNECIVQDYKGILKSNYGTCWDQVELERHWFETHDYEFKTIFIWFEINKMNNLPTHSFLIYEENGKYYWFEHSFFKYQGIHEFNSIKEAIEYVKDKQFEYATKEFETMPEYRNCIIDYEYTKPLANIGVQEYLNHILTKNKSLK